MEDEYYTAEEIMRAFAILKYESNDPMYRKALFTVMQYVEGLQELILANTDDNEKIKIYKKK